MVQIPQSPIDRFLRAQAEQERILRSVGTPSPAIQAFWDSVAATEKLRRSVLWESAATEAVLRGFSEVDAIERLQKQLLDIGDPVRRISEAMRSPLQDLTDRVAGTHALLDSLQRDIQRALEPLEHLSFALDNAGVHNRLLESFRRSVVESDEDADITSVLADLKAETAAIADEKRRKVDPAVLNALLAIFLFLLNQWFVAQSNKQLVQAIEAESDLLGARLADSLVALVTADDSDLPWVPTHFVSRALHLRSGPSTESSSLRVLDRFTFVQVGQRSSGWVRARVLDPEEERLVEGWLYGRYVRTFEYP